MTLPWNKQRFDGFSFGSGHLVGMGERFTQVLNSIEGQSSIGIGAASANVDVDPALHGRPLTATNNGVVATGAADATATTLLSARWHATTLGRFTVTYNANATALTGFSYRISAPLPA